MLKRWLAVLGVVVLIVCTFQLLWGVSISSDGDEYPWHGANGGGGTGTISSTANTQIGYPLTRIYIVRPAPMGGFYLIRINLSSGASVKTAAGIKKVEN